jgi:hypothetical protein
MMTLAALLSWSATRLVLQLEHRTGLQSVVAISELLLGSQAALLYSILDYASLACCQIAYLCIGSDAIGEWLNLFGISNWTAGWRRALIVITYSLLIPVALGLPRDTSYLSTASASSVLVLLLYVIIVVYEGFEHISQVGISPTAKLWIFDSSLFNAFAIYTTAFTIPSVILPLLQNFDSNLKKRHSLVTTCFVICWSSVVVSGIIGYLVFGEDALPNFLMSFESSDKAIQTVRAAFFVVLSAAYPVIALVMQSDISAMVFANPVPSELPGRKRLVVLLMVHAPVIVIAMGLPNIRPILEIGGALGGCICDFVYPPLLSLWVMKAEKQQKLNIWYLLFVVFGVLVAVIATWEAVLDAVETLSNND